MTEHDFELLSQYLDGELPQPECSALERRLAAEPALRREWQRIKQTDEQVRALVNSAQASRVPPHVAAMLQDAPTERQDNPAGAKVLRFPSRPARTAAGLAIAASLIAAVGLTLTNLGGEDSQLHHPALATNSGVAQALESAPSSLEQWIAIGADSELRPVLSFAGAEERWCREYVVRQHAQQWRGVACRDTQGWSTEIVVADASLTANGAQYQPAGAGDAEMIANYVDTNATDIPLSSEQEAALITRHWQ